jgi:AcrR family transcriptional regulator
MLESPYKVNPCGRAVRTSQRIGRMSKPTRPRRVLVSVPNPAPPTLSDMAQAILEVAGDVFVDDGYAAFGLRRVAAAAGMSLSTLQYHFRSIGELLTATVQYLMDLYLNKLVDISKQKVANPEDRLRNMIEFSLAQIRQPKSARVTFEAWAVAQHNERAREILRAGYELYRELFAQAIEKINPNLNPKELQARAMLVGAQIDGLMLYTFEGGPAVLDWTLLEKTCVDSCIALCGKGSKPTAR